MAIFVNCISGSADFAQFPVYKCYQIMSFPKISKKRQNNIKIDNFWWFSWNVHLVAPISGLNSVTRYGSFWKLPNPIFYCNCGVFEQLNLVARQNRTISSSNETMSEWYYVFILNTWIWKISMFHCKKREIQKECVSICRTVLSCHGIGMEDSDRTHGNINSCLFLVPGSRYIQ